MAVGRHRVSVSARPSSASIWSDRHVPHAVRRGRIDYDVLVIATGARPRRHPVRLGPARRAPPAHARRRRTAAGGLSPWHAARDRRRGADRRRGRVDGARASASDRLSIEAGPGTARARVRRRDRGHAGRALAESPARTCVPTRACAGARLGPARAWRRSRSTTEPRSRAIRSSSRSAPCRPRASWPTS